MTARGKIILTILILGIAGFGAWKWWDRLTQRPGAAPQTASSSSGTNAVASAKDAATPELADFMAEVPTLPPPAAYQVKSNTVVVELSEYAGYSGFIAANGGLEPNTNSIFFKKHGFLVHLTLSEEESWPALNSGKMAASATTADVLAVYGKQFQVIVPAQIGYSRGADGVVVRSEFRRINALKGKILTSSQFTEADFFIRYLAQEAGLGVHSMPDLKSAPDADKLNLIYCKDEDAAGDFFLRDMTNGGKLIAGCVTWDPKTTEVAEGSGGKAHILTTSVNLLIIADIFIVNKGFAQEHPDMVAGLVDGLMQGNRMVREGIWKLVALADRPRHIDRRQPVCRIRRKNRQTHGASKQCPPCQ